VVNFNNIRKHYQLPDPVEGFQQVVEMQGNPEAFVLHERLLTLGGQVGIV